jgi:hypothetical protein
MKKLLLALALCAISTLAAQADEAWRTAPDGMTPLFLKPSPSSHCFDLGSADGRYFGGFASYQDRATGQWHPIFDGPESQTILADIMAGSQGSDVAVP